MTSRSRPATPEQLAEALTGNRDLRITCVELLAGPHVRVTVDWDGQPLTFDALITAVPGESAPGRAPVPPRKASGRLKKERVPLAALAAALDHAEAQQDGERLAAKVQTLESRLTDAQVADPAYPALKARLDALLARQAQRHARLLALRALRT